MIKVWNKDIKFMGYITNVSSVQWHSKFADYGSFEIHMPLYGVVYDLIEKYNIIQFNNNFGFILSRKQTPKEIIISGYDLNGLTARRVGAFDSKKTEIGISEYMNKFLVGICGTNQLASSTDKITIAEFGKLYRNSEWLKKAYEAYGVGYKIYLKDDTITYDVLAQNKTSLIFSMKYKNIIDFAYMEECYNDYDSAKYNYIFKADEYVSTVKSNSYTENQVEHNEIAYNDETFSKNAIGESLLWEEERKVVNYLSNSINTTECIEFKSNLIYGIDYNLGDIVTIEVNTFGEYISKELTITEVQEVHEPNKTEYTITTGEKGDNYIKRLIKKGVI